MLWFFATLAACAEILTVDNSYKSVNFITSKANTVHYIVTKWLNPEGNDNLATSVTIYRDSLFDNNSIVYNDKKHSVESTFFFTTSLSGKYYVVITALEPSTDSLLLECNVYSGASNKPTIVSSSDVEMMRAERQLKTLLERAAADLVAGDSRLQESESSRRIYEGIISKALWIILFKVTVTTFALVYSSMKTKSFYNTQYSLATVK